MRKVCLYMGCLSVMLFSGQLKAQSPGTNPLVRSIFTADPAAMVYNDRMYIYTGRDEATTTGTWFRMLEWHVLSTSDMINWTDHGAVLKPTNFSWANGDAWAGHCVQRNGKFYWYVSMSHKTKGGKAIGVAVSNSPTGPFTDAKGSALITTDMTPNGGDFDDIDPAVFVDDDGQAYMYWGNGSCKYVKLNADMISFSGPITTLNVSKFGEAPWLHKKNGLYYLSYSSSLPSTIEYATSSSPIGPWTYRGRIADPVQNCGTSHQALIEFRNQWYFVYHNGALPTGGDHRRSVCVEYMCYNSDGTIKKVTQTTTGATAASPCPPAIVTQSPFKGNPWPIPGKIEAEDYDLGGEGVAYHEVNTSGNQGGAIYRSDEVDVETTSDATGSYNIAYTLTGEWLEYTVNVSTAGSYNLDLRVASNGEGKTCHVEMDGVNISKAISIPNTGGYQSWQTVSVNGLNLAQGKHIIRIAFDTDYLNLNFVEFKRAVPTGLEEEANFERMISPNPFGNEGFQIRQNGHFQYSITNMGGQLLEQGGATDGKTVGASLSPGIYILSLEDGQSVHTYKIVRR